MNINDYQKTARSLKNYWDSVNDVPNRIRGNHHHALVGFVCFWWLSHGKDLGFDPVLLTGEHAGKKRGHRAGGGVADSLLATKGTNHPEVVGIAEAEIGARCSSDKMASRLVTLIERIKKNKTKYHSIQFAIIVSPTWYHYYSQPAKIHGELERVNLFKKRLDKLSSEKGIIIFNCLSEEDYSPEKNEPKQQTKWSSLEVFIHSSENQQKG